MLHVYVPASPLVTGSMVRTSAPTVCCTVQKSRVSGPGDGGYISVGIFQRTSQFKPLSHECPSKRTSADIHATCIQNSHGSLYFRTCLSLRAVL